MGSFVELSATSESLVGGIVILNWRHDDMENNVRHWPTLMLRILSLVVIGAAVVACHSSREDTALVEQVKQAPIEQVKQAPPVGVSPKDARHPLELTPEDTLRTLLEAFIRRDIETVLAYYHPSVRANPERIARIRQGMGSYMTDRKHVKRIVEIRLDKITASGEDKVATLWAKIETTPRFSGVLDLGGNVREYRWVLRQLKGKGPWFHDGGGF